MALTLDESRRLRNIAWHLRRSDPSLHRALALRRRRLPPWSIWCAVYVVGSALMLTLGAMAGASLVVIFVWLGLVAVGTALIRAQDRCERRR
jgi:hypothetical protein